MLSCCAIITNMTDVAVNPMRKEDYDYEANSADYPGPLPDSVCL